MRQAALARTAVAVVALPLLLTTTAVVALAAAPVPRVATFGVCAAVLGTSLQVIIVPACVLGVRL